MDSASVGGPGDCGVLDQTHVLVRYKIYRVTGAVDGDTAGVAIGCDDGTGCVDVTDDVCERWPGRRRTCCSSQRKEGG